MKKIVVAYFLMLVDFELLVMLDYVSVILPFFALALLLGGFYQMGSESDRFERAVPPMFGAMSVRMLIFFMRVFDAAHRADAYLLLARIGTLACVLFVSWQLLAGLRDVERENKRSFGVWLGALACAVFCVQGAVAIVSGTACVLWMNTALFSPLFALVFFASVYQLSSAYLHFVRRSQSIET